MTSGGLTKFGAGALTINTVNSGFSGVVTLNAGTLTLNDTLGDGTVVNGTNVVPGALNNSNIVVNGGTLTLNSMVGTAYGTATTNGAVVGPGNLQPVIETASSNFSNAIYINADSTVNVGNSAVLEHIPSLTFASLTTGSAPAVIFTTDGLFVSGVTTLGSEGVVISAASGGNAALWTILGGQVTGGSLTKSGNGWLSVNSASNNYTGGTTIDGGAAGNSSVLTTIALSGTPFGAGAITVNPGATLRLPAVNSAYTGSYGAGTGITLVSDSGGLAGIGVAYDGALPTFTVSSSGPFGGVLAIDTGGLYIPTTPLNLGNIGGSSTFFLGSTTGATYAGALTSSSGVYRLGGGNSSLTLGGGLAQNILTGSGAVQIGALSGGYQATSIQLVNGNGTVVLSNADNTFSGTFSVNLGSSLTIANAFALGTNSGTLANAVLQLDGGAFNSSGNQFLQSNVNATLNGDWLTSSSSDLVFAGNVSMSSNASVGATRTFNISSGAVYFNGILSGAAGSNLIKAGGTTLGLNGVNTYVGTTTITAGTLIAGTNVAPNVAGAFGVSDTPIILGGGTLETVGLVTISRDINTTAASTILGGSLGTTVISGGITDTNNLTLLEFGVSSNTLPTFAGGQLDIQGAISGAGNLTIGTNASTAASTGTVRLSSSSNGYSLNTFTGGVNLGAARLVIAANSDFSGTPAVPTILSGPLGTGTLTLGTGANSTGGQTILTDGSDRVIVNPLGAITAAGNTVFYFAGSGALDFSNASQWDLSSDSTGVRNRTFNVTDNPGVVTFGAQLVDSSIVGIGFIKTGDGTLVLSNTTNNFTGAISVSGGLLSIGSDAVLGNSINTVTIGTSVPQSGTLQVTGSFTTGRDLVTSNGFVDVTGSNIFTVSNSVVGGGVLNKLDTGTLVLGGNPNVTGVGNLITTLNIFGGGTVQSTATGTLTGNLGTTSVVINGGALALAPTGSTSLTEAAVAYQGGSYISLTANGGTTQLTATTLTRTSGGAIGLNNGALVIVPGSGNLGSTEQLFAGNFNAASNVSGVGIVTPSIVAQTSALNTAATFVTYDAVKGFIPATPELPTTGFTTSNVNAVATISSAATDTNPLVDVYAVQTSANITGAGETIRIDGGGLIINGSDTISTNLTFGTSTTPGEALIYVSSASTGTLSGSINAATVTKFGPGNLAITGTGNELIPTGLTQRNVIVQQGTLTFAGQTSVPTQANLGGILGGTAVAPQYAAITLNDTGTLDVTGNSLIIGGLNGNNPYGATFTTLETSGLVTNSGANATLTLAVNNASDVFSGAINNGAGTLTLVKTGTGYQSLTGNSTYSGGTTINAGTVISNGPAYGGGTTVTLGTVGTGPTAFPSGNMLATGILLVSNVMGLGTNQNVTLDGGVLGLHWDAANATDALNTFNVVKFGPGAGYNLTVAPTMTLNIDGVSTTLANNTSTVDVNNIGTGVNTQILINNLTVNSGQFNVTGGNSYGLYVAGTTTLSGNTVINTVVGAGSGITDGGGLLLFGQVSAAGDTITKIGANDLRLGNGSTTAANNIGGFVVAQGQLVAQVYQGGSDPLGSGPITINGGTLRVLDDGDNTTSSQLITLGNSVLIGSANSQIDATSTIDVQTIYGTNNSTANDKTIVFSGLSFNGLLGAPVLATTAAPKVSQVGLTAATHAYSIQINGTTTMLNGAALNLGNNNDAKLTLNGLITGNGTLFKGYNASNLYINWDNSLAGGYQGGTVIGINTTTPASGGILNSGGTVFFGAFDGTQYIPNLTAKLGAGNIMVEPGAAIQFNALTNLNGSQDVEVRSNLGNLGMFRLATDATPASFNLRAGSGGGNTALTSGAGVLAINTVLNQSLNQMNFGDGTWYFGSTTDSLNLNGTYNGATMGAGAGNLYRLGAGGTAATAGTLYIGDPTVASPNANVLTGSAGLVVGTALTGPNNQNFGSSANIEAVGFGSGTVVLSGNENYTGATTVNRLSVLELRGTLASASFDIYGQLTVGGPNGTLIGNSAPGTASFVLEPGSQLRFDNTNGASTVTNGRISNSAALTLNNTTLFLVGSVETDVTQNVGALTSNLGQSTLQAQLQTRGRSVDLNAASINRLSGTALLINPNTAAQLGSDERITVTGGITTTTGTIANFQNGGAAVTVTNGMVPGWAVDATDNQFLTYSDFGFVDAGFNLTNGAAVAATLGTGVERLDMTGTTAITTTTNNINVYALLTTAGITGNSTAGTSTGTITIAGGGLIDATTAVIAGQPGSGTSASTFGLIFGSSATPIEADIFVASGQTLTIGTQASGILGGDTQIQANGLVKFGVGSLTINSSQSFTGGIFLDAGILTLNDAGSGGSNTIFINGAGSQLNLRALSATSGNTYLNGVTLGANVPYAIIDLNTSSGTAAAAVSIATLTFNGPFTTQGQILQVENGSTTVMALSVAGATTLKGTSVFNDYTLGSDGVPNIALTGGVGEASAGSTLVKMGTGTLFLGTGFSAGTTTLATTNPTTSSTFTGGILLEAGILQASATAVANSNVAIDTLGAGNTVTLYGGTTFNVRVDQTASATFETATFNNNPITMDGSATINVDHVGAAASTNKAIAFSALNIGSQTLTTTDGDTYALQFNAVNLSGLPTFNLGSPLILNAAISDGGAGLFLTKIGSSDLWFNTSSSTFSGGLIIDQGALRFGNPGATNPIATAGTGAITLNPNSTTSIIRLSGPQNLNAGQQVNVVSTATFLSDVDLLSANITNLSFISANSSGVLSLDGVTTYGANGTNLNLASIGNGTFFFGANTTSSVYVGSSLGVGAGNIYRLGGGAAQLSISPANVPATGVLTGSASLLVGSLAADGTGTVVLTNVNSYSGGTVVNRGSTLTTAAVPTASGTAFGSGQIDVFNVLNDSATFKNFANNGNQNTVVLHPGGAFNLTAPAAANTDRWNDTTAIALNGGTFTIANFGGTTSINETVGQLSFAYGSTFGVTSTSGVNVTTVTSSLAAEPARVATNASSMATLSITNLTGTLGSASTTSDRLILTSGAPARGTIGGVTINMIAPWYVSSTDSSFLDYNPVTGFTTLGQASTGAAGYTTSAGNGNSTFAAGLNNGQAIVDVTTQNQSLIDNPIVYALRTAFNLSNGTGSAPNIITIEGSSTGDMGGGLIITGTPTISANLLFANPAAVTVGNPQGLVEAVIFNSGNSSISGDIAASTITKFGAGTLTIGKDQPNYTGGWTVNAGALTPATLGALGQSVSSNVINLNGNGVTLNLSVSTGNTLTAAYTSGGIVVTDNATIAYSAGSSDRVSSIAIANGITVNNTASAVNDPGANQAIVPDAQLKVTIASARNYLDTGLLTLNGNTQVNISETTASNGSLNGLTSGLQVNGIANSGGANLDKWGNGYLFINGASAGFTGGAINIQQGSIQVNSLNGLGTPTAVNVSMYGILDVAVANYTQAVNYAAGASNAGPWTMPGLAR